MNTSAITPAPAWKRWYRRYKYAAGVGGAIITIGGGVLSAFYWIAEYKTSCESKGGQFYLCIGDSLGLIDIDRLLRENEEISTLRMTLEQAKARVQQLEKERSQTPESQSGSSRELSDAQAALKRAAEDTKRKDARIAELEDRLKKATEAKRPDPPAPPRPPTRPPPPEPKSYSQTVWPSGTIPYGVTVRAETQYGTLECTGGNNNTGAQRNCSWPK